MSELKKTCKKHGELKQEDILIDKFNGYLACRICKRINNKKQTDLYRSGERIKETMKCRKHGILNKNQFHLDRNGAGTCKICAYYRGMKRRYGISEDQYNEMLLLQNYTCLICKKTDSLHGRLYVDHNHNSYAENVRGLLCFYCNLMLGNAKDNPEILRAGADYLEK